MKLIISGLGLIICTVALIYMIVKKPNSKQRNAEISKNTLQLIPERDYDDELEAFIVDKDMTGYQYMDLIEIKSQDLQNLSDDEVYFNMAKFSRCFKRYDADIKIIPDDPGRRIVTDFRYLCIAEIKKDRLEFMHKEIIFPFYGR